MIQRRGWELQLHLVPSDLASRRLTAAGLQHIGTALGIVLQCGAMVKNPSADAHTTSHINDFP